MIEVHDILENNKEFFGENIARNTQSVDTDPEADLCKSPNNLQQVCLTTSAGIQLKSYNNESSRSKMKNKSVFESFAAGLPTYEYDQKQIRKNLLKKKKKEQNRLIDMYDLDNNRFLNYYEAFLYIAKHCQKNNQRFTKESCKQYLKQCYIMDFSKDGYIPISDRLKPKLFNKYFRFVQRELKFI